MDAQSLIDPEILPLLAQSDDLEFTPANLAALRSRPVPPGPLSDEVQLADHLVPGRAGAPDVAVRVHRPKGAPGPLPCVYSIHGGGYVTGSYAGEDTRLEPWCLLLGCAAVAVEYRLAPETPFPGPLEDCYAGLAWVHEHAGDLGIDAARVGISGTSAGGGLAAALALLARDRAEFPVAFQLLLYPMIDDRQITPSSRAEVPVWNPAANQFGWRSYLGDLYGTDRVPAHAAPARADDLGGLPPACVVVGTVDGFYDEDVDYALRLNRAGVPTELHVYPGAPHGFHNLPTDAPLTVRARHAVTQWLAARMGVPLPH